MIAFTICSNNYFAHAKVLAKSWLKQHPSSHFVVFLTDVKRPEIDYSIHELIEVIPIETLNIDNLPQLIHQYNIVELNTAIKADAYIYLFEKYEEKKILYIDPDIKVYAPLTEVEELLDQHHIILTPHFITPIDDGKATTDYKMIGSGLFNLGFLALSDYDKVKSFLLWWRERLYKYGYYDLSRNMFYDQVWCNYVPVFFDNYFILKHLGYNVANWNFHERYIAKDEEGALLINNTFPLRFFHFSGFKHNHPNRISFYHDRFDFNTRPDIVDIYKDYLSDLHNNDVQDLSKVPCYYFEEHKKLKIEKERDEWNKQSLKEKLLRYAVLFGRKLIHQAK